MSSMRYSQDGRTIDREAFYRMACDPRQSVAVEACAGSGKTWLLVSRMLRALLGPLLESGQPVEPHEILAITFTKKATGEMRRRLNDWLTELVGASDDQAVKLLAERGIDAALARQRLQVVRDACTRWLLSGRPVQVRTIHGWFASLLRGAPLSVLQELGIPLDYTLLEDDAEAISGLWPRLHRALLKDEPLRVDFSSLIAEHGRHQVRKMLEAVLAKRLEFELADAYQSVASSVLHFAQQFADFTGMERPEQLLWDRPKSQTTLEAAALMLSRAGAPTFAAAGVALRPAIASRDLGAITKLLLTKEGEPRKFNDKIGGIEQVRAAQALLLRVAAATQQHLAWLNQQRLLRLSRLMLREFSDWKRERAWVDMQDLERAARHLLADPVISGWLQERLDLGLKHLLIDEFQDTSPLQWQALQAWLSAYAGSNSRVLTLFIVGDPKQSIYRFRGAEPKVFAAAQEFIRDGLDGVLLGCDHTQRNALAVVQAINGVMSDAELLSAVKLFRSHSTESRVTGAVLGLPLVERPQRLGRTVAAEPTWRDSLTMPRWPPEEELRLRECRQVADWVVERIAQGATHSDIMILARKRDRLVMLEGELRARHIACEQPERTDLGETCEVMDLLALLDVLLSPQHDLSLARALKSPLFGASDEDLVRLALQHRHQPEPSAPAARRGTWLDLLRRPQQEEAGFAAIGKRLSRWQAWLQQLPPHDALVAIYEDGEVLRRFAQVTPAAQRARVQSNLKALLAASLELNGGRYATPYALVRRLRKGGVKAAAASGADAVRLITIHGAKGLEANHVLILDSDAPVRDRARPGVLLDWPIAEPAPRKFVFLMDETAAPACCQAEFAQEQAARWREELNALYVAMTRARTELVFSALQAAPSGEPSWWARAAPYLASVDSAAGSALVLPPAATTKADAVDQDESNRGGREVLLICLPTLPGRPAREALIEEAPGRNLIESDAYRDNAAHLGRAMHRLLELWPAGLAQPTPDMMERVRREFALAEDLAQRVRAMALRVVHGEAAWAWDPNLIDWSQNEVEIVARGQSLRLDRLVHRRDTAQWWVLDYKSSGESMASPERVAQLRGYRDAVQQVYAGEAVRAAFLGADGRAEICD